MKAVVVMVEEVSEGMGAVVVMVEMRGVEVKGVVEGVDIGLFGLCTLNNSENLV